MRKRITGNFINYFIASVWLVNGLLCKVFNLVPRHQQIVERILNVGDARLITMVIGLAETALGIWILLGFWSRHNTIVQISIVALMNTLEFVLAPDLLLWGKANAVFAFIFILLIYYKEFHLDKKKVTCYHS
jgi:hypothetical protein